VVGPTGASRPRRSFASTYPAPETGAETVVIDLRGVTFIDSCGIGELVGAQRRAHRVGRPCVVVESTQLDEVLHIAALDKGPPNHLGCSAGRRGPATSA
jgi:anti-anti-sigma factor